MKCPDCAEELETVERKQKRLDACSRCSGIWLPQPALAKLVPTLDREGAKVLPAAAASQRCCPSCGINMSLISYQAVELDFCGACHGVWFDKEELGAAMARQRSGVGRVVAGAAAVGVAAVALQVEAADPGLAERVGNQLGNAGSAIVDGIDLGDVVEFVGGLLIEVISGILE